MAPSPQQPVLPPAPAPAAAAPRLFIALWPPPALARALHAQWAGVGGEPAHRLHLTLHYLGLVAPDRLPALQAALCRPFSPFTLRLAACERWPQGLWVARPEPAPPALLALHADLARVLAALGLRTESRAFRPHVTLARPRGGAGPAAASALPALDWPVRRYVLVQSLPGPPPRYQALQTCPPARPGAVRPA